MLCTECGQKLGDNESCAVCNAITLADLLDERDRYKIALGKIMLECSGCAKWGHRVMPGKIIKICDEALAKKCG